MHEFIRKHEARIHGVLSCFDRMLFRGYLPIMSGWSMAQFLNSQDIGCSSLKPFLLENAERVKDHAIALAKKHGRPFQYLTSNIRKEDTARKLAERDGIEEGLVCVFSILEPCRTFSFRFQPGRPYVQDVKRAMLLSLRAAGCESVKGIRDASGLLRGLDAAGVNVIPLRALCRHLTLGQGLTASEVAWNVTLDLLHDGLAPLLPADVSRVKFGELSVFERPLTAAAAVQATKECIVSIDGRSVRIQIGTVASVKGETHVATLVLESYGGQSKKFDLETAQRNISGAVPMDKKASDLLRGQYRNLYVAMSRPRHFLCLAMNKARSDHASVAAMVANGWVVAEVPK